MLSLSDEDEDRSPPPPPPPLPQTKTMRDFFKVKGGEATEASGNKRRKQDKAEKEAKDYEAKISSPPRPPAKRRRFLPAAPFHGATQRQTFCDR